MKVVKNVTQEIKFPDKAEQDANKEVSKLVISFSYLLNKLFSLFEFS